MLAFFRRRFRWLAPLALAFVVFGACADAQAPAFEADARVYLDAIPAASDASAAVPWNLDRIDSRTLDGVYAPSADGAGVAIYLFDTGVDYAHPALAGRAEPFFDYAAGRGGQDCNGHGTWTAAIAASVAPAVRIYSVRVLACDGTGRIGDVRRGADAVLARGERPAVVNMSFNAPRDASLDAAVDALADAGFVVAVAAGNSWGDACDYSPAAAPRAVTVAATDRADARAPFSNSGDCVDLLAPGVEIESAWLANTRRTLSGTSASAPHVAATAATILAEGIPPDLVVAFLQARATRTPDGPLLYVHRYLPFDPPTLSPPRR